MRRRSTLAAPKPAFAADTLDPAADLQLMRRELDRIGLDLSGMKVVVGAATGYRAATATIAALAGARSTVAIGQDAKRNPASLAAMETTMAFARLSGISEKVSLVSRLDRHGWRDVDIVASCPEIGPVAGTMVELLPPSAVVALMGEPWEIRPGAVDYDGCAEAGVAVAALNLAHPDIALMEPLARLCCRLVEDARIDIHGASIAVLCDTPLAQHLKQAFAERGAAASVFPHPLLMTGRNWDAVIVAMRPAERPSLDINGLSRIMECARHATLVQFSGEVDRLAASYFGLRVWPRRRPARGQLGLPADQMGFEFTLRRLVGGLKIAELVHRQNRLAPDAIGWTIGRPPLLEAARQSA